MKQIVPKYSLVIPYYNRSIEMLQRSLGSVLNQDKTVLKQTEIIIVNDGSDEKHTKILTDYIATIRYQLNITIINYKKNRGLLLARTSGMRVASGKFILTLDCDDEFTPIAFESIDKYLTNNPRTDLLIFETNAYSVTGKYWDITRNPDLAKYKNLRQFMKTGKYFIHSMWDKVYSNKLVKKYTKFFMDEDVFAHISAHEDFVQNMVIAQLSGKLGYLPEPCYIYYEEESNSVSLIDKDDYSRVANAISYLRQLGAIPDNKEFYSYIYEELKLANKNLIQKEFNNIFGSTKELIPIGSISDLVWHKHSSNF